MTQTEDFSVEDALRILRTAIEREKHIEKLRDNLTQLGNHEALGGWLTQQIDKQSPFWLAFFEVDRFKNINDQFGYPNANLLLQKIARHLNDTAKDFFTSETLAFRAHGDEFFLASEIATKDEPSLTGHIHEGLDQLRGGIARIRLRITKDGKETTMFCTVSVGWMLSEDYPLEASLTPEGLIDKLQHAVARAKESRNCVIRFDPRCGSNPMIDGRLDCNICKTKFSLTIPKVHNRTDELFCPNCGTRLSRPPSLAAQPLAPALSEVNPGVDTSKENNPRRRAQDIKAQSNKSPSVPQQPK